MEKPKLILIAACDRNRAIGKGNTLPWRHRGDMANFKNATTDNIVVMGSKTYESMGSKPLKNRVNIVITSRPLDYEIHADTYFVRSVADAIELAHAVNEHRQTTKNIYVIGGASIYQQFLPHADVICLTRLDLEVEGADTFFPEFDENNEKWHKADVHFNKGAYDPNDVAYEVCVYQLKETS